MEEDLRDILERHLKSEVNYIANVFHINLNTIKVIYSDENYTIDHIILSYDERE